MTALRSLTPDESQRTFRACLDALARPGTVVDIDTAALPVHRPSALLPMLALTDLMTPVGTLDANDNELRQLARITGARTTELGQARWALGTNSSIARFRELSTGSEHHPEHGAMVCLQVTTLGHGSTYELRGPGIDGVAQLAISGLPDGFVEARAELVDTPPCGVDFLLVSPTSIAALPRTTALRAASAAHTSEVFA